MSIIPNMRRSLVLSISIIVWLFCGVKAPLFARNSEFEYSKNLSIYYDVMKNLNMFYVDRIDPSEIITLSIRNSLKALDPYTIYYSEEEIDQLETITTGEYGGIGVSIFPHREGVVISSVYEGFPAGKVGLRVADKILKVNEVEMTGKDFSDISDMLKGAKGSTLTITYKRFGEQAPQTVSLTRESIKLKPISYSGVLRNQVGYIALDRFTVGCSKDLRNAVVKLKEEEQIKGLVLDLRGNGGGLLDEAVKVCNVFLPKDKLIVSTKGKRKETNSSYHTRWVPVDTSLPMLVLIDGNSASASEIVAGALQDYDRALLLGERSLGKGLVQSTIEMSYNTSLKLTTAKYYIPSGRCIQEINYSSHSRNSDSDRPFQVPDSLRKEYFTLRNKRSVWDGRGIMPDIPSNQPELSAFSIKIVTDRLLFDFVTEYYYNSFNKEFLEPEQFEVTPKLLDELYQYLLSRGFKYEGTSSAILKSLKEAMEKDRYYTAAKKEYEQLEERLKPDMKKDFQLVKEEVSRLLTREILRRHFSEEVNREYLLLQDDSEIDTAINILSTPDRYEKALHISPPKQIEP